jgi:hypothetical protein
MSYRTPETFIYQGRLDPRPKVKPCARCGGKLGTGAKAAGSNTCSACAAELGELTAVPLMALTPFRTHQDWHWIHDRYINNGPRWREAMEPGTPPVVSFVAGLAPAD